MSNMVVNTNVLALNSHRALKGVGNMQAKASAKLSSGSRINSAADDAAGLAISEKMRAQIRGLDMASKNSQDAISLIQTAEGGMQEIDNMLQRVRELVNQSANDTNENNAEGTGDRQKIQDEITQLVAEIDSMAERTEFNNKKVINGDYANQAELKQTYTDLKANLEKTLSGYKDAQANKGILDGIKSGLDSAKETAKSDFATALTDATAAIGGTLSGVDLSNVDSYKDLVNSLKSITTSGDATDTAELDAFKSALNAIDTNADEATIKAALGTAATSLSSASGGDAASLQALGTAISAGGDIDNLVAAGAKVDTAGSDFLSGLNAGDLSGWQGTAPDLASLDTEAKFNSVYNSTSNQAEKATPENIAKLENQIQEVSDRIDTIDETKDTKLFFQVGANSNQKLEINVGRIKSDVLGIGDGNGNATIDVVQNSGKDITGILKDLDKSLSYVSTERSKLGAAQNRLEYTIKSLDISSENLSAAESRIRDADMAKEMMNLTKSNVLQQAATSMLAQANQAPQNVLRLLN